MKATVLPIVLWLALGGVSAQALRVDEFAAAPVFSTPKESLSLPAGLSFEADEVRIAAPSWFATLFGAFGCDQKFSGEPVAGTLKMTAADGEVLGVEWRGRRSGLIAGALARYVPVHYSKGRLVHPYFTLQTRDWVTFHAEIDKSGERKILRFFLLKGKPAEQTRQLVFEASGR